MRCGSSSAVGALAIAALLFTTACSRSDPTPPPSAKDDGNQDAASHTDALPSQSVSSDEGPLLVEDPEATNDGQRSDSEDEADLAAEVYTPRPNQLHQELHDDESDHQLLWLPEQGHAQAAAEAITLMDMPQALQSVREIAQEALAGKDLENITLAREHLKAMQFQVHNMTVRLGSQWSAMQLQAFLVEHQIHDLFQLDRQLRQRHAELTRISLLWP